VCQAGGCALPALPTIAKVTASVFNGNIFPTYIAHLFGKDIGGKPLPFLQVDVTNPTDGPVQLTLSAELQGYSFAQDTIVSLAKGETKSITVPMAFKTDALYASNAAITANLTVSLSQAGQKIDTKTQQLQIATKNTVFWKVVNAGKVADVSPFAAVMATPKNIDVETLITAAGYNSAFGKMYGYGSAGSAMAWKTTVMPGVCKTWYAYYPAGQQVNMDVSVTCSLCTSYNAQYWLIDQANYQLYKQGLAYNALTGKNTLGNAKLSYSIGAAGWYFHQACNPESNSSDRSYTVSLPAGLNDVATDQMSAVFQALKDKGIIYTNVATDFFAGAQNVKTPAESLKTGSANCIDGTLVFASALEAIGMRPVLVLVPHHAFVAVHYLPDGSPLDDDLIAMETTMVGTAAAGQGLMTAATELAENMASGTAQLIDIQDMRNKGFVPAPF